MKNILKKENYPILLIIIGLIVNLLWIYNFPVQSEYLLDNDGGAYIMLARNLADHNTYGNSINGEIIESIYRPVGYPFLISVIFKIFGSNNIQSVLIFHAMISSLSSIIIYRICKIIGMKELFSFLCSLAYIFYLEKIFYISTLWSETAFNFFNLIALYLILKLKIENQYNIKNIILTVFFISIAYYIRPISVTNFFVLFFLMQLNFIKNLRHTLILIITFLLFLSPWSLRNSYHVGELVGVSANTGINIFLGNHLDSNGSGNWPGNLDEIKKFGLNGVPNGNLDNVQNGPKDEYIKNLNYKEMGIKYIIENKIFFLENSISKLKILFSPDSLFIINNHSYSLNKQKIYSNFFNLLASFQHYFLLYLTFVCIIYNLLKKNYKELFLFKFIVGLYLSLILITFANPRFFQPIAPLLLIFIFYTINYFFEKNEI